MDRDRLQALLAQELSLAEIGRRVGLHESTVGYWVAKHGLEAANRARVAPKGGLTKAELAPMVQAGMSAGAIAVRVGRSKTTVRHWLREYGLKTQWAVRREASSN